MEVEAGALRREWQKDTKNVGMRAYMKMEGVHISLVGGLAR